MGVEGCLVCPPVFKTGMSSSLLGWVRFPPTLATTRCGAFPHKKTGHMTGLFVFAGTLGGKIANKSSPLKNI